ncbi:MAG: class I SAM-dependent methyltransferase [Ignavibacterium sp.]
MLDSWNERYSTEEFVYGINPNEFFKETIDKIQPGKLLLLGEGEGRNAIYAAKQGWDVTAVDWSESAKSKALKLARGENVLIDYIVESLENFEPEEETFDVVGLIFLHLEPEVREEVHKKAIKSLKENGILILEAFDKEQLGYNSGGPKDETLLYSLDEIVEDFIDMDFKHLSKEIINLNEGILHNGEAVVIKFVGVKNNLEK